MKIAMLQSPLAWEDIEQNKKHFLQQLNKIEEGTDLVVLPEMFVSGFTMNPERVYITMQDNFIAELQSSCREHLFALIGSVVIKEGEYYYNRLFFISDKGEISTYDKRHLFSLAGEEKVYKAGKERLIVEYRGWKICPLVCYDLRFPVFSRNNDEAYDLLIYVASWPDQRIYAWDSLLKARAIENMSYLVAVNRCGVDENDNIYTGHSQALDMLGKYLVEPIEGEHITYIMLDKAKQDKIRKSFGVLRDADTFTID
ncbi:nitrilase family protein [Myroides marinus]|nr:nitrilase family protein [Myroides marinus]MDM1345630.1 nitrilase family protein [Myroides marinus]MDM1501799.1 nitrilase family protein [Myroides marinus]MDM1531250.1 nitrilase family protein [Myroides marinus]MDM1538042.1 nitrilase family protein [Myroides marinus]